MIENFSIKNEEDGVYLIYEIEKSQNFDETVHKMISNNNVEGFFNVIYSNINDKRFYKYNITSKINLNNFLKTQISKDNFLIIISNILAAIMKAEYYMIGKNNILLDKQYIYIDISNCEIFMLCLPLKNASNVEIKHFFKELIDGGIYDEAKDISYIILLRNYLNSVDIADYKTLLDLINSLKNQKKDYAQKDMQNTNIQIDKSKVKLENVQSIVICGGNEKITVPKNDNKESSKEKMEKPEILPSVKINGMSIPENSKKADKIEIKKKQSNKLLNIFKKRDKTEKENSYDANRGIQNEIKQDEFKDSNLKIEEASGTIILSNDNGNQTVLFNSAVDEKNLQPCLIRLNKDKTQKEEIYITKDVFKLGSHEGYVDYTIKNESTISRSHADIITENGRYYIRDNNSKNHTAVNGVMVDSALPKELKNNDSIKLCNVEFIFKI